MKTCCRSFIIDYDLFNSLQLYLAFVNFIRTVYGICLSTVEAYMYISDLI